MLPCHALRDHVISRADHISPLAAFLALSRALSSAMAMAFVVIAVALCCGFDISVVAERELSVALVDASENLFKNIIIVLH